jgi:hypothetical protein
MRIGIVSDTHGNAVRLQWALDALRDHRPEALVHCGDLGHVRLLELLAASGVPVCLVAGNMDRDLDALAGAASGASITFHPRTVELRIADGQYLVATHGDRQMVLDDLIAGGQFPYVCHGHTHRMRDEQIGACRVINPGALHQPRGGTPPTAALLDTRTDELGFLEIG